MQSETSNELRRIRNTLIVMAIFLLFIGGNGREIIVNHNDDEYSNSSTRFHKNLVPLGNGYFGLYSGNTESDEDNRMNIYYYDEKENKLVLKREQNLDTVELGE